MDRITPILSVLVLLAAKSTTNGFAPTPRRLLPLQTTSSSTSLAAGGNRINQSIDLDSPKVATMDKLEGKKVYCRCWQSGTFPLCDGAHMSHNKETGDNVGPLILSVAKPATEESSTEVAAGGDDKKSSILDKIKSFFKGKNEDDGLTTKERLAKMGLSALLSYGWVSNMSYAVALSLSWYGFSKKTGLSPLAPGQWKPFLAVYAGFYVFNNIVRPLRFGLSVIISRYFDNFVNFIEDKTKLSRKLSIGVVVFLANVVGTFAAMGGGVLIASTAAGVPIFPPKV
mmetsp:Transcript_11639/g.24832  ORF Transcript_11639/g.24832 Transcript_11639/m.24832 type:complete len:284 (+) Transcript_11639:169-1020(+)